MNPETDTISRLRDEHTGELPSYAWPGGYQILYLTEDNGILCPDCANEHDDGTLLPSTIWCESFVV